MCCTSVYSGIIHCEVHSVCEERRGNTDPVKHVRTYKHPTTTTVWPAAAQQLHQRLRALLK